MVSMQVKVGPHRALFFSLPFVLSQPMTPMNDHLFFCCIDHVSEIWPVRRPLDTSCNIEESIHGETILQDLIITRIDINAVDSVKELAAVKNLKIQVTFQPLKCN